MRPHDVVVPYTVHNSHCYSWLPWQYVVVVVVDDDDDAAAAAAATHCTCR